MTSRVNAPLAPGSLDDDYRINDFLARHGGPAATPSLHHESPGGLAGWSEVFAADGHILRCEWSKQGDRTEMNFVERLPGK